MAYASFIDSLYTLCTFRVIHGSHQVGWVSQGTFLGCFLGVQLGKGMENRAFCVDRVCETRRGASRIATICNCTACCHLGTHTRRESCPVANRVSLILECLNICHGPDALLQLALVVLANGHEMAFRHQCIHFHWINVVVL